MIFFFLNEFFMILAEFFYPEPSHEKEAKMERIWIRYTAINGSHWENLMNTNI